MKSSITETQLSNYRSSRKLFSNNDFVALNESPSRDNTKPMVFLSHKHDELTILQNVISFLIAEGVDIYVDWMDNEMPAYTNAKTAIRLKKKIRIANKFILVATPNAINSKWCNWELGLGDAAKYKEHIALLPIDRTNKSFNGSEYLKIYPFIQYEDGNGKYSSGKYIPKGYYVFTPLGNGRRKVVPLKEWLVS